MANELKVESTVLINEANSPQSIIPLTPLGRYVFTRYGNAKSGSDRLSPSIPYKAIPGTIIITAIKYLSTPPTIKPV